MDATAPPINIHIALSVGEPVKKREMSELNDVVAMTPNTMRRMPTARRASEIALLMYFPLRIESVSAARTGVNGDFPASQGSQTRGGSRLNPTHEKQYDEDDQNDADDTDAPVSVAISVAAEAAAKPTEQEDNQDDDEHKSDRHGAVLSGT